MSKRLFAVIGHPIGHTMSPFIHKRLFSLADKEGEYTVLDVAPEDLEARLPELDSLAGYNITIPNKQRIIPLLDRLNKKAELYGSVNTVRNGAAREGFTTDPDGFLKAIATAGIPLRGRVVIVGCGGVARTFAYEAMLAGCSVTIAARPQDTGMQQALMQDIHSKLKGSDVSCCSIDGIQGECDLLINATPVGMYPNTDASPVNDKVLSRCACVFDAVYNPLETLLLKKAKSNGSKVAGGMAMLVWQAAAAHEIWDGSVYNNDDIAMLIQDSAAEQIRLFG